MMPCSRVRLAHSVMGCSPRKSRGLGSTTAVYCLHTGRQIRCGTFLISPAADIEDAYVECGNPEPIDERSQGGV